MTFEKAFGKLPGDRPESYWRPWLGDHLSLRPSDVADLTAEQMVAGFRYVSKDD